MKNKIDWNQVQKDHDNGLTWSELKNKYKTSFYSLAKAKKLGLFKSRNKRQGWINACNLNKFDFSIRQNKEYRLRYSSNGGFRKNAGRCKGEYFNNLIGERYWLQGSWEKLVAQFMNSKKIHWIKNSKSFPYFFDNKNRLYYPDFYLPDLDVYIEVKGYQTDKDLSKWKQFPFKLIILKKEEVFDLKENLFGI